MAVAPGTVSDQLKLVSTYTNPLICCLLDVSVNIIAYTSVYMYI